MAAKNNYVDRKWELAREYGFQNSYKYWDPYLDSLLEKSDNKLEWYDKAMLNVNPDLAAKREAYQKSLAKSNKLQSDLTNIQSAQQFLQNNVSQQKDRINKLYDLQDKAAAISASIQWTNRVAGWLWAASNVLSNSRWITDAQMQQQILQNSAQRESALSNVAQQEANLPSVLASLDQANANAELARAQAKYYNNQATTSASSWWGSYSKKNNNNNNNENESDYEILNWLDINWQHIDWVFIQDKDWNIYDTNWQPLKVWWQYTKEWMRILWWEDTKNTDETKEDKKKDNSTTIKAFPTWVNIPTLWTWSLLWTNTNVKNVWFTKVGNRVSL